MRLPTLLLLCTAPLMGALAHAAPTPLGSLICVLCALATLCVVALRHWLID